MQSEHVRKTLAIALKQVEAYEKHKDPTLLEMVKSLIVLAIEDLEGEEGIPQQLIPYMPLPTDEIWKKQPLAPIVVMYMAAPVGDGTGWGPAQITVSGDTVSITPGEPATEAVVTHTKSLEELQAEAPNPTPGKKPRKR